MSNKKIDPSGACIAVDIDLALKDVATDRTVMNRLFLWAYDVFQEHTRGGVYLATNSGKEGIDEMMGGRQVPALVSQGTLLRMHEGGDYIPHPKLNWKATELTQDIYDTSLELIQMYGYTVTSNGTQLTQGQFLKPENKDTCFCIVFDKECSQARDTANNVINEILKNNSEIREHFHRSEGVDAIELVPYYEPDVPFEKLIGIERMLSDPSNTDRNQLIIVEDSNESMLRHLHKTRGAFNVAVGDGLSKGDYIGRRVKNASESRQAFINAARVLDKTGVIDLNAWRPEIIQGRVPKPAAPVVR